MNDKLAPITDKYPEHDKLLKVAGLSQSIGDFLAWLSDDQHVWLAKYDVKSDNCRNCGHPEAHDYRPMDFGFSQCAHPKHEIGTCNHGSECEHFGECKCDRADFGDPERMYAWSHTTNDLLATYFEIDTKVLEEEGRAMLDTMRALHATSR